MNAGLIGASLLIAGLGLPLSATALVLQQYISPAEALPAGYSARPVYARASHHQILFATNSDYVEEAQTNLMSQCQGRLTGITVTYAKEASFLSYYDEIHMQGLCIEPATPADAGAGQ